MEKLKLQSPLLEIVDKVNQLVDVVTNDSDVVKSLQKETKFSEHFKMETLNRSIYTIKITGSYKIKANTEGNIYIRLNENEFNERSYQLNRDNLEINNLILCNGDKLFFISENAEADDDVFIELEKNIIKYIYDTKNEIEEAINLYRPLQYEEFTEEQIEYLKGDPFRYSDFTEEQLEKLRGPKGDAGKSAYETAKEHGFKGTESDFGAKLNGPIPNNFEIVSIEDYQGFEIDKKNNGMAYVVTKSGVVVAMYLKGFKLFENPWIKYLAKDSDFSGDKNGEFKYIGDSKTVYIPQIIKGIPITSYQHMFMETNVEKVISDNANVTSTAFMFANSSATTLDLSNFELPNSIETEEMFHGASATVGYARAEEDANILNSTFGKPNTLIFVIKK